MSGLRSLPLAAIRARGMITGSDVQAFRKVFYEDGIASAEEAELLLALHEACKSSESAWRDFFIEAMTDYVVFQSMPQGYVTADKAHWLLERISENGIAKSRTAFDLAVDVLEKARWAPISLAKFALEQLRLAVVSGGGNLRTGVPVAAGTILDTEVDLLRRILYAFGGSGSVAITRDEAAILFDIDQAVAAGPPSPAWTDLFVKALTNIMMAASGYAVPSREEALRQEAVLDDSAQKTSVLAFLLSMVRANLASVQDAYHDQTVEERALARLEHQRIEIITNESITEAEAVWLASRMGRDGRLSPSELALVSYLRSESPRIHPVLFEAVERLGHAA